ncbi:MAG: HAD family hydrolase [Bacteroidales bacterium]|nr:HAD family hydrolase [Bacteroidales bacterium]
MKTFQELKRNCRKDVSALPTVKVALVGDTATQLLSTAIIGTGVDRGLRIDLFEAEYNQVEQQFLDPGSDLHAFGPELIIVFQSTHKWAEKHALGTNEQKTALADERLDFVRTICSLTPAKVIYLNYPEIDDTIFGSYANRVALSFTWQVRKFNYELMRLSQEIPNLFVCDLAALQNKFGRDMFFDASIYTGTEMILSLDSLPFVSARILDIICALKGKFKKCLILDLDNTVWGGVVGDDGLEGIQLGHGLGIGKAFTEFQMWVKKLKDRGIILCICSKNDEDKAKEPFEKHPDMVLRIKDIAVFMANWETKVDNIRSIQQILNIGFDSMVFLDDNPFERNIVREHIPDITVPELPDDPAEYLEYLYSLNLFETASYSSTDKDRTQQYQVEAKRSSYAKTFQDEAAFLKSLDMVSSVEGFTAFNTPRVAQLSQRSNQFNLRTVRYTEGEIEALSKNPDVIPLTFTLEDKFGDNGLICVIIMKRMDAESLFVDTWFMSCRVLKRGMENFTLNTMVAKAREKGCRRIVGEYLPTLKNGMVKDHYDRLGFTVLGGGRYELDTETYQEKECFIKTK